MKRYLLVPLVLLSGCGDDEVAPTQPVTHTPVIGVDQSAPGNGTSVVSNGNLMQEFVPQAWVMNYVDIYRRTNFNVTSGDTWVEVRSSLGWTLGTSRVAHLAPGQINEWIRLWFDHNIETKPGEKYIFEVFSSGDAFAVEWSQSPGLYPYGIAYAFGYAQDDYDLKFQTGYDVLP